MKGQIHYAFRWLQGRKLVELKLFGIQLFLITDTKPKQYNIFALWIPLFRIVNTSNKFAFNILPCVWLYKGLILLLTKWKIGKTTNQINLTLLGKKIWSVTTSVPYRFPTAHFRDV